MKPNTSNNDEPDNIMKYRENVIKLFIIQKKLDNKIRGKLCLKCKSQIKRRCINHNGELFCNLLVNKRKKIMGKYWIYNLINFSPYYKEIREILK